MICYKKHYLIRKLHFLRKMFLTQVWMIRWWGPIQLYLHEILSSTIFNYSPCKYLLYGCHKKHTPKIENWKECNNIWVGLSTEPFQNVHKFNFTIFHISFKSTHDFFLQRLCTETGLAVSYCPVFRILNYHLKRKDKGDSVEVHAIYALFYSLCAIQNGILHFKEYLLSNIQESCEPLFIAQYLLAPVNTIVKTSLHPWMMKPYLQLKMGKVWARNIKAELFLKYMLLLDVMTIDQKYGRKPDFNFDNDENLAMVLDGAYGPKGKVNRNQVTIAFDSFLTIYLVTLPEKFKQW